MIFTPANLAYLLYCASIAAAAPTAKRASGTSYDGGLTANDVTNDVCAPLTLIFARGSTEQGNMGSTVGPALAKSLISSLGNSGVAIQGVDYDATIESNASLGADGGPEMAKLANQALKNCPNTKIALSGYSQGATVTHYAVAQGGLSADDVSSATLFGDPEDGTSVGSLPASKLKEFCASGDGVCEDHGFDITAAHLSYATGPDIGEGAQFIINASGGSSSGSSSGGSSSSGSSTVSAVAEPSESFGGLGGLGGSGGSSGSGSGLGGFGGSGSSGLGGLGSAFPTGGFGGLGGSSGSGLGGLGGFGGSGTSGLGGAFPTGGFGGLGGSSGSGSSGFGGLGGFGSGSSESAYPIPTSGFGTEENA